MSDIVHSPGIYSDTRGGSSYINHAKPGRTLTKASSTTATTSPNTAAKSPKSILSLRDLLPASQKANVHTVDSEFPDSRTQLRDSASEGAMVDLSNYQRASTATASQEKEAYHNIYESEEDAEAYTNPLEKKDQPDLYKRQNDIKQIKPQAQLSDEEVSQLRELQTRDRQVRSHETAHLTAAGTLAKGGIRYEYEQGPDGRRYVVDGHVQIDTSPGQTPEETIKKAQQIRAAAMASADASSADMNVASSAIQMEMEARRELQKLQSGGGELAQEIPGLAESGNSHSVNAAKGTGSRLEYSNTLSSHSTGIEHLKQCQDCLQRAFETSSTGQAPNKLLGWG